MKIDTNKYLGTLCKRGHEYQNTGKSLRLKSNNDCVLCTKITKKCMSSRERKRLEQEAREFASLHCTKYQECRDEAAYRKWGGTKMKCYQCVDIIIELDCYQREIENYFYRDGFGEHIVCVEHGKLRF